MSALRKTEETPIRTVVWRGLAQQGIDYCSLWQTGKGWLLKGIAITLLEDGRAMRAEYKIDCDRAWRTRHVSVESVVGSEKNSMSLTVDPEGVWHTPTESLSLFGECVDIDLAITPATNMLPIRRLDLAIGESRDVNAAWLKIPDLTAEVLPQCYTRLDSHRYRYRSGSGFSAELQVDDFGLITSYPAAWEQIAAF
jgi:hypothetical protein